MNRERTPTQCNPLEVRSRSGLGERRGDGNREVAASMMRDFCRALVIVLAVLLIIGHIETSDETALTAYEQQ